MASQVSLLALPAEILGSIALSLYSDGNQTVDSLKDLSSTCRLIREITVPVLFHTRSLAISADVEPLQGLLAATDLQWMKHINTLILRSEAGFSVITGTHIARIHHELRRFFERLVGLRTLRIETCHTSPPLALSVLRDQELHIILNLQNGGVGFNVRQWEPFLTTPNWRWSVSAPTYQFDLPSLADRENLKLKALKRVLSSNTLTNDTWLQVAKHSSGLEELHLIGKQIEIGVGETPTLGTQVRSVLQKTPSLRRLRIEGSTLIWHLLPQIPLLTSLRHLTLYSGWKIAFHRLCTDEVSIPIADLPWLSLPHLKYLDLRFVCNHFSINQIVPPGLLGFRIELFGPKDYLSVPDIHWLQRSCPDLERLELDVGTFLPDSKSGGDMPGETSNRLDALSGFRNLRVLRLFPRYWQQGTMHVHPMKSLYWPVTLFARLSRSITSLRQLHICMSYGDYPFDIVPRMTEARRPLKFRVLKINDTEYTLRYGFAYSDTAIEARFRDDLEVPVSQRRVKVRLEDFFDDLDVDWTISHSDYVGCYQRADDEEE